MPTSLLSTTSSNSSSSGNMARHDSRNSRTLLVSTPRFTPASRRSCTNSITGVLGTKLNIERVVAVSPGPASPAGFLGNDKSIPSSPIADAQWSRVSSIVTSPRSSRCHGWSLSVPGSPISTRCTLAASTPGKLRPISLGRPLAASTPPKSKITAAIVKAVMVRVWPPLPLFRRIRRAVPLVRVMDAKGRSRPAGSISPA
jgi:hypothetical protein